MSKRALGWLLIFAGLGGLAIAAVPGSAVTSAVLARPPGEFSMFTMLNGEPTRWTMPDGGQSGMYGSGIQCMPVPPPGVTGGVVLKMQASAAAYLCVGSTDGGCNTTVTDINYGDPLAASTNVFVILRDDTTRVCQLPVTGSVNTPVFRMQ